MATNTLRFLTVSQVQRLHARFVVPNAIPSQPSLLESAVNSPMNMKHYANEEDIFKLAVSLAEKIMKNHAFQDGTNAPPYWQPTLPFAEDMHSKPLANAHVAVVTNQWTFEQLGDYYKSVAAPPIPLTAEVMEYRSAATEY
ncbi:hypothetical protein BDV12DRAFT_207596 [Aspergillus spectabilis]